MESWGYNYTETGSVEVREGVCKGVDPTKMYHTAYCDGRMSLAFMIAMLVLGFVTVIVNLGVIIRTVKILRKGEDKPAFFFIGNLALSDFAVGLFVVIAFLLHITNKSDLWQQNTCMLHIGVAVTACQETIFTIVLISVDKYIYICHSLHYSILVTRGRVYGALVLSWCLAILVGSLPAMGLHVTWAEACDRCVFPQVISTTFAVIFFVTSVAVPLLVVVSLYSILLVLAVKMHKARYGGSYTGNESARSSNFRLSFMSKRSRSSNSAFKTSCATSSSTSSSSKVNRQMTRRKQMEEYKAELARQDGGGGGGDGACSGSISTAPQKSPESVQFIDKTDTGVPKDATPSPTASETLPDVPSALEEETYTREDVPVPEDTSQSPAEDDTEETKERRTQEGMTAFNGLKDGTKRDEEAEEVPGAPEVPQELTSDEEGATSGEGNGETQKGQRGGWRSLIPSKYMNKVMAETRDKVLFLKKCRAVKTVLLILVSFTATYVPFVVGSLVYSAQREKRPCLLHLLNTLLYCAVVSNSLANPLIYAYGYREFRIHSERFKGIFAREKRRNFT